jgi:phosphatidylserine decarboxylase
MVSPADGTVLHFSNCKNGYVEQVKGVDYSLRRFFGRMSQKNEYTDETEAEFVESLKQNPQNDLYQIVIYLAPGDYHRFHSPSDFYIKTRRHYPGGKLNTLLLE